MSEFRLVISDPETGKAIQTPVREAKARVLLGRKMGEVIPGDALGLPGYELRITGGSDSDGFPMRRGVHGTVRKKILLSKPPAFKPSRSGERRRKAVRGDTITDEITQINFKIVKKGAKPVEELIGIKPET